MHSLCAVVSAWASLDVILGAGYRIIGLGERIGKGFFGRKVASSKEGPMRVLLWAYTSGLVLWLTGLCFQEAFLLDLKHGSIATSVTGLEWSDMSTASGCSKRLRSLELEGPPAQAPCPRHSPQFLGSATACKDNRSVVPSRGPQDTRRASTSSTSAAMPPGS